MIRFVRVALFAASASVAACGSSEQTTAAVEVRTPPDSGTKPTPPQSTPAPVVARLELQADTIEPFVGLHVGVSPFAFDANGNRLSTEFATISSSEPSVASLVSSEVFPVNYLNPMETVPQVQTIFKLLAPGTTTISFTLGGVSSSISLHVLPLPPAATALVVDSFTVVEYRATCSVACPYLYYAPLLRLREPTGNAAVHVISVEFSVPTMTTGLCRGDVRYAPGESKHLNPIYPDYYQNDLFFSRLDGSPLPDGPATARILIRDAKGVYSQIEASTSIQRMVQNPVLPAAVGPLQGWSC